MQTKNQRPSRDQVRASILLTARDIAATDGWSAVTVRKIAERIGYTAPIIYEHFGSKNDMLSQLLREGYILLLDAVSEAAKVEGDSRARVHALANAYWDFAHETSELYRLMFGLEGSYPTDNLMEYSEPIVELVAAELMKLNPRRINASNVQKYVVEVWSVIHGLVALSLTGYVHRHSNSREVLDIIVDDLLFAFANNDQPTLSRG